MRKLEFTLKGTTVSSHDAAYVLDDEMPRDALIEAAIQNISTSVEITIAGVTMHLAGWQDPDHWSDDWREKFGDDVDDDVPGRVDQLLAEAIA